MRDSRNLLEEMLNCCLLPLPERKLPVEGLAAGGGQEPEQAPLWRPRCFSASVSRQDKLRPENASELRGAGAE